MAARNCFIAHLAEGLDRRGIDIVVYSNGESTVKAENRFLYGEMEWPALSDIHAQFKDANHSAWAVEDAAKSCDIIHLNNATGLTYSRFVERAFVYTVHHPKVAELSEYYRFYPDIDLCDDQRAAAVFGEHAAHADDPTRHSDGVRIPWSKRNSRISHFLGVSRRSKACILPLKWQSGRAYL